MLKIVTELDAALGKQSHRIIQILEGDSQKVMITHDESLSVGERSRLEKGKRSSALQSTLIELCGSDASYDASLWLKLFPNIIRLSLDVSPLAVEMGREIVCTRLVQMHDNITRLDSEARLPSTAWRRSYHTQISASASHRLRLSSSSGNYTSSWLAPQ